MVGQNVFEGAECYEVKLVRTTGFEYTEFFNVKTGLLAGMKMNATSQMGTIPVVQVVSDYKTFGGVLTPTVTRQQMMGVESEMTITEHHVRPGRSEGLRPAAGHCRAGQAAEVGHLFTHARDVGYAVRSPEGPGRAARKCSAI